MSEESVREIFCENLNKLIERKRVTQKELAEYMNVAATTVNGWVRGTKIPRMDKIDRLCAFFQVGRSDLLEPPLEAREESKLPFRERSLLLAYRSAPESGKQEIETVANKFLP